MRIVIIVVISILGITFCKGQTYCNSDSTFRVLHFTKTTGYDHNTRANSAAMFAQIGVSKGFTITDTQDAAIFDELDSLKKFAIIVFSNTSGNTIFDPAQKVNMESYIDQGGSFIGIHAATDTYRTGWDFYNYLVGAIVQSAPNHTSNNYAGVMDHQLKHPILDQIPDPWNKNEEYYYWDNNGGVIFIDTIIPLIQVRSTGSQSYDHERPITWIQSLAGGGRSFYTALGHANSNYTDPNNDFGQLISNAVCWAASQKPTSIENSSAARISGGSVFVEELSSGIIIKSINGTCFKLIVSDTGKLEAVNVTCPE